MLATAKEGAERTTVANVMASSLMVALCSIAMRQISWAFHDPVNLFLVAMIVDESMEVGHQVHQVP